MNPSIDLRIQSMLRALTEAVIPALDPNDALAQEQAKLLLGHLHALKLQHGLSARLEALELDALRAFARELLAVAGGGSLCSAHAATLVDALVRTDVAALSIAVEDLIVASGIDGTSDFRLLASTLTLAYAKATALRGRSWFSAMGFDSAPGALPSIATMLDQFTSERESKP